MNTPSNPRHRIIEAPGSILRLLFVTIAILAFGESTAPADDAVADAVLDIAFESTPPLPDGEGLAGAIAGRSGSKIIIAGGANFPNEPRWETEKVWHDAVQVLDLFADSPAWTTLPDRLPRPIAYGVSLTHPTRGVISIGGADADEHLDDAFILTVDRDRLIRSPLPDLPSPLAYAAGVLVGDVVVVMGGQAMPGGPASDAVYTLDLSNLDSTTTDPVWRIRPVIPTGGRILPVAATHQGEVFLFSGVALEADGEGGFRRIAPYLVEALAFDPRSDSDTWRTLADLPRPAAAAAGPAIPVGFDLLAIVGGDDGSLLARISDLEDDHPGFPDDVLVYHPITDRWTVRGRFARDRATDREPPVTAATIPVTGTGTSLDGGVLLASGEIRPRKRTPELAFIRAIVPVQPLAVIDWIAIAGYGLVLVWMGIHFSRRENGTEDYFLAGRRIPWWAAGISIFATSLSAITFMAIPAKSWSTDWIYFLQNLGILAVAPLAAFLLVPYFRRLDVVTAYEYLERRFHWSLRLAASALYMLFQVGRVAVVTLLPALALTAITGLDVTWGVEAVIWSDVLQAVILLGGAIWALMILLNGTDGGFAGMLADAGDSGKLRLVDASWDLTRPSLLVIVLGAIFGNLIPYASDQSVVQRYLTVRDEREAKRAIIGGAVLAIPASLIFFGLGTALWSFYRSNPELLQPTAKLDQILPMFVIDQLPPGISGLVVAALFAAAMSSLDSAMNSVSTAFTTDWYRRFRPNAGDRHCLRVARFATIGIGVIGTGAALLMQRVNDPSLLDVWFKVLGLFGSGVAGVFLLGALTRRAGAIAGWSGLVAGATSVWAVGAFTQVSGLAYAAVGILACLTAGVLVGLVDRRATPFTLPPRVD
ncbi:MAG: sodium:solute symporter family protein [Planctomycetota bacterium]|jgi:SSS family transporter